MRLIYIASAAHSGSTLLDLMLNGHPEIISVGEVLKLSGPIKVKSRGQPKFAMCSCGAASLQQCDFWSRVNARIMQAEGRCLWELDLQNYRSFDARHAPNVVLFKAISAVSGKGIIVDSSKSPNRLSYLLRFDELDIRPIHLVRDPRGQVNSVIAKHGLFKGILRYEIVQEQIRRRLRYLPHSIVRYEDLVLQPEQTLCSILEPLGMTFHPRQLAWAEQVKHSIAGNHLRWQETSELVLDERWKSCLNPAQKLAINIGTLRSRSVTSSGRPATARRRR
jgi:hypothetical protein